MILEQAKQILRHVSFDRNLFLKELIKAIDWIDIHEINHLKNWCISTFDGLLDSEVNLAFQRIELK